MPTYLTALGKNASNIPILENGTNHPWPSDFISPELKASDPVGLMTAKAIYYSSSHAGPSLFFNDRKSYKIYSDYALGENSEDDYKPLLRIDPTQAKETFVGAMRWAIKNYATKRLNIVVSKVTERKYDPQIDPLDQNAINKRDRVKQRVRFLTDFKAQNAELEQIMGQRLTPEDIDPSLLPETTDELELWSQTHLKYAEGMAMEKLISHHWDRNRIDNLRRLTTFDDFVFGAGVAYSGMDENQLPENYRVKPSSMLVPHSDREDMSDIDYCAEYMDPTVSEFYKMVGNSKPKEWVIDMVRRHRKNAPNVYYYDTKPRRNEHQPRMEILRFWKKSVDEIVHVNIKEDQFGNERFLPKNYNEYEGEKGKKKFKEKYGDSRELYRTPMWTSYEGFWIIGSEEVFRYGPSYQQEKPRGIMGETMNPYKFFAANMKEGRTISTIKQMIPVLDELQTYHIKKQHVIANAMPSAWVIDLDALRDADFEWNNKKMDDQKKVEFLFQSNVFLYSGNKKMKPGSNWLPLRNVPDTSSAPQIMMYAEQMRNALMELDEIIGMNKVSSASSLRPDQGKGTAEIQERTSDTALDYLYRSDEERSLEMIKSIGVLSLTSVKSKKGYYEDILSPNELELLRKSKIKDFGFRATIRPTQLQWEKLYQEAMDAVKSGSLGWDDFMDLQAIQSLKEARNMFRIKVRKRQKQRDEFEMGKINGTVEGQMKSAELKYKFDKELKQLEKEAENEASLREQELEKLKHKNKMREIRLEKQLDAGGELLVAGQKGEDSQKVALIKILLQNRDQNQKQLTRGKTLSKQ